MYLKILCDKWDILTQDILKKFHDCGYKMQIDFIGEKIPESDDGFLSFYSRRLAGSFVQLSLCDPRKIRKNFSALKNIIFLYPEYVFKDSDIDILSSMEYIITTNYSIEEKLECHGLKRNSIIKNIPCFYEGIKMDKLNTKKYTFLFHANWVENMGWKEMLFSYCNAFPNREADLIISTNEKTEKVNEDIDRFMSLNNFDRTWYADIFVVSNKRFEEVLKFANCFVVPYLVDYYDQNIIIAMRCGIPLIISRLPSYQNFCRKNTCWLIEFIGKKYLDTELLSEIMKNIVNQKNKAEEKALAAKDFLLNNYGSKDFFDSIIEVINNAGVKPISNLDIVFDKEGIVI